MSKDIEAYTANELALAGINQLKRIASGIERQNSLLQQSLDARQVETGVAKEEEVVAALSEQG